MLKDACPSSAPLRAAHLRARHGRRAAVPRREPHGGPDSRGLSPEEAARRARVEFGSMEKHKEESRASFGLRLVDEAFGDARYALRTFARNKSFTATAIADARPRHRRQHGDLQPDRCLDAAVAPGAESSGAAAGEVQVRHAEQCRRQLLVRRSSARWTIERQIFSGVAGFSSSEFRVGAPGSTARVPGAFVTGSFYDTLGLTPVIGRLLTRDDDRPGAPLVAVASYGYWERQFALDPSLPGRTAIVMNGVPATIVGVSPRGFVGANVGQIADLTIPVAAFPLVVPEMAGLLGPGNYWLRVLARPQPGAVGARGAGADCRRGGRASRRPWSRRTGRPTGRRRPSTRSSSSFQAEPAGPICARCT